ncbi:alpha/beta hydrolase [Ruegeria sp. 2012CJ41-6]|uniref:Alpha/beta hydrolase n=1 Tax=Ruegeria spongiae TaxID=2942209 RepID=A0ABT0PYK9_9RHOB|nr:alpha/beta hydrolase [Ruegeria spongiae]MCL6282432.1 alpha/beta hydrolase [Ruegeria spongiae]
MRKVRILFGFIKLLMPEPLVALIYTGRRATVAGRVIDAKAQAVGDLVALLRDPDELPPVEESRRQLAAMAEKLGKPCPVGVATSDILLPGAAGDRPARVYVPAGGDVNASQPTLFYLHGGGWIQGGIDTHDGLCGALARQAGVRVISYEYRLAPEDRFPAAPDDVLAAYRALIAGDTDLSVAPEQLVVGGDSAGGNLTASLMHDLVTAGIALPRAQMLIYPGLDARLETPSIRDLRDQPLLPATRIDWYINLYLPEEQDRLDPRVSPTFSETLASQPEALIIAGGHDPLWDDAQIYAAKLTENGVKVELLNYPGQIHAFMSLTKVIPQGNDAVDKTADWLRRVLKG